MLVSRSVNCTILDEFSISLHCVECIFIKCSIGCKSLIVGVIYRPPNGDVTEFFTELNNIMSRLEQVHCDIKIVCGDFNFDLLKSTEGDINCLNFMNLMYSSSLLPLITKPTRVTDGGFSLIDNIFVTNPSFVDSGIIPTDIF